MQLRDPKAMPPLGEQINSPYEPEARYGSKRGSGWIGYKVHLTETCEDDLPHLLTNVQTTIATEADIEQLDDIQAELARLDLLPDRQLVDAGYVRARNVVESRDRHQVDLVGPIFQDRQWQAMAGEGFDASHFRIDWERKEAISPEGKRSVGWSEPSTGRQRTKQKVRFASEDCRICSSQSRRVTASGNQNGTWSPVGQDGQAGRGYSQVTLSLPTHTQRATESYPALVSRCVVWHAGRAGTWTGSKPMIGRRTLLAGLIAGIPILTGCAAQAQQGQHPTREPQDIVPYTGLANGATVTFPSFVSADVKDGYQFAVDRPDVLRVLPCYCGCGLTSGHKNNLDCFILGQDKGGSIQFDDHASYCQTCLDIARDANRLLAEGKSLPEIRDYVDQTEGQKGPGTDTPKPTAGATATRLVG